jgi:GT2 family glycosyltransferase
LLSIVIPSLNTVEHLRNMLCSLFSSILRDPLDVIVVDMSSTDGTVEMLGNEFPQVRVIDSVPNRGYGSAANVGLARATGDHVLVCNSDLVFPEGSTERILEVLGHTNDTTLLGFGLRGADGHPQRSALRLPGPFALVWMFATPIRYWPRLNSFLLGYLDEDAMTRKTPVGWVTGAALAAHRSLFERLGGFDEAFFMNSEEVDLCRRVHQLGGKVVYAPEVTLTHVGGGSSSDSDLMLRWLAQGKARYTRKHFGRVALLGARLGALAAFFTSFSVWFARWVSRKTTFEETVDEARRYGSALLEAWRA